MKLQFYFLLITYLFLSNIPSSAQEYVVNINNEDGLSSNLVKSITQDDQGYIWIATDVGLVRYDGKNFINYQKEFPSLLIKDVKYISKGKLLVISDLGIGFFIKKGFGYYYSPIAVTSNQENDSSLYYAKTIYCANNKIWISDLTGVISVENNKFRKYSFDKKYHVNSIFRTFLFANDRQGNLIVTARNGYFFLYDEKKDKFSLLNSTPFSNIYAIDAIIKDNEGDLLIGTNNGVYKVIFPNDYSRINLQKLVDVPNVSSLCVDSNNNIYIGTWENGLYRGKLENDNIILDKYFKVDVNSIKNLFYDRDKNIWVSTDDGIILIKRTLFKNLIIEKTSNTNNNLYTQEIHNGNRKYIYYTDSNILFKAELIGNVYHQVQLFNAGKTNIQSFAIGQNGIWISFGNNNLEYRDKKTLRLIYSNKNSKEIFFSLYVDKNDKLWAYLQKSKRIVRINNSFDYKYYDLSKTDLINVNRIKESSSNTVYFAGSGHSTFLLKYNPKSDEIENISPKLFENSFLAPIQINDFYVKDSDNAYLATNYGLFSDQNKSIIPLNFNNEFDNIVFKAILIDNENRMWLGTENGIYVIADSDVIKFSRKDGLPNSSIVIGGLALDNSGRIWVGTASGVVYWASNDINFSKTYTPVLSKILVNDKVLKSKNNSEEKFIVGKGLNFTFNTLTYPAEQVKYQYRLIGLDTSWSSPSSLNEFNFYNLPASSYTLQVRAVSSGHLWSNIAEVKFQIIPHWYTSFIMYILYFVILTIVIFIITRGIYKARIRKLRDRENLLQELVNKRTKDLSVSKQKTETLLAESEKAKENLEKAIEQNNQLLSIAAHDLKNPLQAIIGFSSIINDETKEDETKELSNIIFNSSKEMISQIEDMLESVAMEAKNLKLNFKPANINELLTETIRKNTNRAKQKKQHIKTQFDKDIVIPVDSHWLSVAVDNLISNAVKYSPFGSDIEVTLLINNDKVKIIIKDQGAGFTEEDQKKMFNRYQRLSAKPTGGESSTGLGLSIVKDIVDKHNGKIWAENNNGIGASFIIQLPININSEGLS